MLDEDGQPTVVAGVPPDYFSATGQRWGNPLYRWDVMRSRVSPGGSSAAAQRCARSTSCASITFAASRPTGKCPPASQPPSKGRWVKAPGHELFRAIEGALGKLPIIAEDLGIITPEVEALRDTFGFPGMRVLQFAFRRRHRNPLPAA